MTSGLGPYCSFRLVYLHIESKYGIVDYNWPNISALNSTNNSKEENMVEIIVVLVSC